jgi:hypothetical protein
MTEAPGALSPEQHHVAVPVVERDIHGIVPALDGLQAADAAVL